MRGQYDEANASDESIAPTSHASSDTVLSSVDPAIVKAVVKPLLGMSALVILLFIVSYLPGLHRVIPATPITIASLVSAIFIIGIVGVLVYVAPLIERLVKQRFGASNDLATIGAAIIKYLDLLLAVFVAHWGLSDGLRPFLSEANAVWAYDITFLFLAVIPTAYIAYHLYQSLDPTAELITRKITGVSEPNVASTPRSRSNAAERTPENPSWPPESAAAQPLQSSPPLLTTILDKILQNRLMNSLRGRPTRDGEVLTKKEQIIQILEDSDGRIQQNEIVKITGWSKSTVSRVLSEMKEDGMIVKTNIGQGNLIALPGHGPASNKSNETD